MSLGPVRKTFESLTHVHKNLTVEILTVLFKFDCYILAVSPYSSCYGMQVTCCTPQMEKKVIPIVQTSFLSELQSVLDEVFGTTCNRIGRHFNRESKSMRIRLGAGARGDRKLIAFLSPTTTYKHPMPYVVEGLYFLYCIIPF